VSISAGGTEHLVQIHGIMDSIQYKLLFSCVRNLRTLFGSKQTSKSTQTLVAEHKVMVLPWPSQSPDLNPIETEECINLDLGIWRIWSDTSENTAAKMNLPLIQTKSIGKPFFILAEVVEVGILEVLQVTTSNNRTFW